MVQQVIAAVEEAKCIKIICNDTDVFVWLLHFYAIKKLMFTVLMAGTSAQRATVNIQESALKHKLIVLYFLAAHALTGCDTVGCLYGIGKVTVVKDLSKGMKLDAIWQHLKQH